MCVHLQIVALFASPRRQTCPVSAAILTDKGSIPLLSLLGYHAQIHDASYWQQELDTLVATINRHLSDVNQAPVTPQNDAQPDFLIADLVVYNLPWKGSEYETLWNGYEEVVRTVNFSREGRWVSIECMDAREVQLSAVSLSSMHALAASEASDSGRGVSVPTMRARFLCWHLPNACLHRMFYPSVMIILIVISIITFWALMFALQSGDVFCTSQNLFPYCLVAGAVCVHGAAVLGMSVRAVASVEISPDGKFWKVERSLTRPPFQQGAPLESYALWWTRVVAEGSTEDLQGCEVGASNSNETVLP
jgi:hypothetical protein